MLHTFGIRSLLRRILRRWSRLGLECHRPCEPGIVLLATSIFPRSYHLKIPLDFFLLLLVPYGFSIIKNPKEMTAVSMWEFPRVRGVNIESKKQGLL